MSIEVLKKAPKGVADPMTWQAAWKLTLPEGDPTPPDYLDCVQIGKLLGKEPRTAFLGMMKLCKLGAAHKLMLKKPGNDGRLHWKPFFKLLSKPATRQANVSKRRPLKSSCER